MIFHVATPKTWDPYNSQSLKHHAQDGLPSRRIASYITLIPNFTHYKLHHEAARATPPSSACRLLIRLLHIHRHSSYSPRKDNSIVTASDIPQAHRSHHPDRRRERTTTSPLTARHGPGRHPLAAGVGLVLVRHPACRRRHVGFHQGVLPAAQPGGIELRYYAI